MLGERGVLDLDLDLGPGDGGVEGSKGSKGLWLAKFAFGEEGRALADVVHWEEGWSGCLLAVFFHLTCCHLFPRFSIFSLSFSLFFVHLFAK